MEYGWLQFYLAVFLTQRLLQRRFFHGRIQDSPSGWGGVGDVGWRVSNPLGGGRQPHVLPRITTSHKILKNCKFATEVNPGFPKKEETKLKIGMATCYSATLPEKLH